MHIAAVNHKLQKEIEQLEQQCEQLKSRLKSTYHELEEDFAHFKQGKEKDIETLKKENIKLETELTRLKGNQQEIAQRASGTSPSNSQVEDEDYSVIKCFEN